MNITIDEKMLDYIKDKHNNYLIGMITDNKTDRIDAIINNFVFKELFDVVVISADVHSRKSERKIFEEALNQSGLKAEECVFIDNTAYYSNLVSFSVGDKLQLLVNPDNMKEFVYKDNQYNRGLVADMLCCIVFL